MYLCPTLTAAKMLGLTPGTLRSWRRRGIGPSYVMQPGGDVRSRGGTRIGLPGGLSYRFHGDLHWSDTKPNGTIYYPEDKLRAFVEANLVPRGSRLLPRPFPGRLPGGRNGTAAAGSVAAMGAAPRPRRIEYLQLRNAATAAWLLCVSRETLRSWRRRGIGPAYVRFPGGHVRRGKALGHICYPASELQAFAKAWLARQDRLPRPPHARMPAGGHGAAE